MLLKPPLIKLFLSKFLLIGKNLFKLIGQNENPTLYWKKRVKKYGKRSVSNLGHSNKEFEEVTKKQKEEIYPYFIKSLRGDEKLVLDFGCGPGRFSSDLANLINGKAIACDVVQELIQLAPRYDNVEYKVMQEGAMPLPDMYVDVVWVCLVLGGIKGNVLTSTINEINRVLKNDGLLFLIENTDDKSKSKNWIYRPVFQYKQMFPFISLTHLHDYYDLGERISVIAGRKQL